MRVNWGALGISIGLILLTASILALGFIVEKRISGLTVRLITLEEQIRVIRADIERGIIAQGHAFSKVYSEKRTITIEDLKEGYALADKFMGK